MRGVLFLAAGGLCGTFARYFLTGAVNRIAGSGHFPYGTLVVNLTGCLIVGFLSAWSEHKIPLSSEARLFWIVGLLGAFTTFSSLIYESGRLIQNSQLLPAFLNLQGSLALGLLAFGLGRLLVTR